MCVCVCVREIVRVCLGIYIYIFSSTDRLFRSMEINIRLKLDF